MHKISHSYPTKKQKKADSIKIKILNLINIPLCNCKNYSKLSPLKTEGSEREIALTDENIKVFKKYRAWLSEMMLPQSDTPFIPKLDGSHLNKNFGRTTITIYTR